MRTGFQDMQLALQASKESEEKAIKEKTETSNKNKLLEAELKMTSANLEKYKGQAALLTTRSKELAQRLKAAAVTTVTTGRNRLQGLQL